MKRLIEKFLGIGPRHNNDRVDEHVCSYIESMSENSRKLKTFIDKHVFDHLGELADGEWKQTEPNVWTKYLSLPVDLEFFLEFVNQRSSFLVSVTETGTEGGRFHSHTTPEGKWDQHIFVLKGGISVVLSDENGNVLRRYAIPEGFSTMFTPDQVHDVKFFPYTKLLTVMYPSL